MLLPLPRILQSCVVFLLAFGFYHPFTATAPLQGDSSDYAAAMQTLSCPHPPGAVPYLILGKLVSFLPLGSIVARTGILTTLCSALTLGFLWAISSILFTRFLAKFSVVSIVALAPYYWFQAIRPEVYPLSNLLSVVVWYLLVAYPKNFQALAATTVIAALAVTVHPVGALPAIALWLTMGGRLRNPRPLWLGVIPVLWLLGWGVLLYLPIRSSALALIPRTLSKAEPFKYYVLAQGYQSNVGFHLPTNLANFIGWLALNLPLTSMILALLGLVLALTKRQPLPLGAGWYTLAAVSPFLVYSIPDLHDYFVPVVIGLALIIGQTLNYGWSVVCPKLPSIPLRLLIGTLAAGAILLPIIVVDLEFAQPPHHFLNRAQDWKAWRMAEEFLYRLPAGARVYADWLSGTTLWYLATVEKAAEGLPVQLAKASKMSEWRETILQTRVKTYLTVRRPDVIVPLMLRPFGRFYVTTPESIELAPPGGWILREKPQLPHWSMWGLRSTELYRDSFIDVGFRWRDGHAESPSTVWLKLKSDAQIVTAQQSFTPAELTSGASWEWYWLYVPPDLAPGSYTLTLSAATDQGNDAWEEYELTAVRVCQLRLRGN